jgi:hypothetical protein
LLCCDGCPNVVHHQCIGLQKIPDGDWFCEECELKKRSTSRSPVVTEGHLPFGRMEFDDGRIEELSKWLDEIREKRGFAKYQKVEEMPQEPWDMADQDDTTSIVSQQEEEEEEEKEALPIPKKRGRPRKNDSPNVPKSSQSNKSIKGDNKIGLLYDSDSSSVNTNRKRKKGHCQNDVVIIDDIDDVMSIESTSSAKFDRCRPRCYCHGRRLFDIVPRPTTTSTCTKLKPVDKIDQTKRTQHQGKRSSLQRLASSRGQTKNNRK